MKSRILYISLVCIICFAGCEQKRSEQIVTISTQYGNLKIKLYDDTPLHRDNFLKLAKEGFYDDLLIHEVTANYTIKSGAPDSRNASKNRQVGTSKGIDYNLPAEIIYPQHFHKKGALAAVRTDSDNDADKSSSGAMFYIVTGNVYSNEELNAIEKAENEKRLNRILEKEFALHNDSLMQFVDSNKEKFETYQQEIIARAYAEYHKTPPFAFTEAQREAYTTVGGLPVLDNHATVFGEVIESLNVLDSIASVKVNFSNRPIEDIRIRVQKE